MTIRLKIDDLFFELFPDLKNENKKIRERLNQFYSIASEKIKIDEDKNEITIEISIDVIIDSESHFQKLISLCEKKSFEEALDLGQKLKFKNPQNSEIHRILGQIHSELSNQDEAINELIDALRWNPQNSYALLMMGNIYSQYKNDIETALTYYNQVLKTNPNDNLTLNNIGAVLMKKEKYSEALEFFNKALKADPEYPNTYLGVGLVYMELNNFYKAFENALLTIKYSKKKDIVYNQAFKLSIESSQEILDSVDTNEFIENFKGILETKGNRNIKVEIDEKISTAAKIEFAENYNRDYHLVKYKPSYNTFPHLILHELTHLELVLEARKEDKNQLFTSNDSSEAKFFNSLRKDFKKLEKNGIPPESIKKYFSAIFNGINSQIYNTPIDLFIEDRIYQRYEQLRPIQFLSLLRLLKEGINAVTQKEFIENAPSSIIKKSKILNLVNALHFKSLFEIDLLADFKPTKIELKEANEFYKEFLEYRENKEPAEEYEIIQHWGEDLMLDSFFQLIPENERQRKSIDSIIDEINQDPYNVNEDNSSQDRQMKKFLKEHSSDDTNLAVAMYMADAINYFQNKDKEDIKKIAFEFATLGMNGINPKKDGYSVPSIKNSNFSGYKTLAYYYVSWALGIPEMLESIQMPFDEEFALAKRFLSDKK